MPVIGRTCLAGLSALLATIIVSSPGYALPIAGGYVFTNFDFPGAGINAGQGTNANGISNNGVAVGVSIDNAGNIASFVRPPNAPNMTGTAVNIANPGMAFGVNSAGNVVGTNGTNAVFVPNGGSPQILTTPTNAGSAFGINDHGNIVGQVGVGGAAGAGFFLTNPNGTGLININAPTGSAANVVNAQGVNNNGQIVGFYAGNDGNQHGFTANTSAAVGGTLTGTAIADPVITPVEPGATFVFSQVLGINDSGLAVGYYGDSTTSQHGYFYNTNTGQYTFLDDPSEGFVNGVEVTQITGIANNGEISGFYSDASGVFHGFVACPVGVSCVPEPSSLPLMAFGVAALGLTYRRYRRHAAR